MSRLLELEPIRPPSELKKLLRSMAPKHLKEVQFRRRPQVGMGSLGRPRYIMLAQWDGAWIAREAKAIVPPAKYWLNEKDPPEGTLPAQKILEKSIRCPDPFLHYGRHWVNRRLAPHCGRIELTQLVGHDAEIRLLAAMGQELANVHLGSGKETAAISHYLGRLPKDWLVTAAEEMLRILIGDWRIYGEKVRKKVPPSAAE